MGKDESGEPATKKFKQSQLCFKSPTATKNDLKHKKSSDESSTEENIQPRDISKENNEGNVQGKSIVKPIEVKVSSLKSSSNISGKTGICNETKEKAAVVNDSVPECKEENRKVLSDSDVHNKVINKSEIEDKRESTIKDTKIKCTEINEACEMDSSKTDNDTMETDASPNTKNSDVSTKDASSPVNADTPSRVDYSIIDISSKADVSLNDGSISSSKSDISTISDSENDERATSSSSTPVTPSSQVKRQMTPKMLKRHEESIRKKQLQQQLKQEKHALKEKMRNERLEQKMKEEEKRKQMQEEKKKKRLAEIELKNEEKRLKQEDKRLKREKEEEEKKKKKKDEERKKERAQVAFASFFKKQAFSSPLSGSHTTFGSQPDDSDYISANGVSDSAPAFMPFPVKSDMRLASVNRRTLTKAEREKLDSYLKDKQYSEKTYVNDIKTEFYIPGTSACTWPPVKSEDVHDCIIIEAQVEEREGEEQNVQATGNPEKSKLRRAKLLQFCENRRPAYFGTWTKKSKDLSGRRPFAKDSQGNLDYEVDSDSDWEEEEEGEDLENLKDDENEGQEEEVVDGENGYVLDNTFVPHGYLSDEEQPENEELLHESVEKQKDRLVALKEEFDEEMKQGGAQALKPKLLGCLWVSNSTTQVSKGSLYEVLLNHRAVWDESSCLSINVEEETPVTVEKSPQQTPSSKQLPAIVLQEIAIMVEGSRWSLKRLIREVSEVVAMARPENPVSKIALSRAIKNMASKTLDSKGNSVWTIKPEFRSELGLQDLDDTPVQVTPEARVKCKETLLDTFLKGQQPPPQAKKRISLTPVFQPKQNPKDVKSESTSGVNKTPEATTITKKKVAFVTLPPRTPNTSQNTSIPRTPGSLTSSDGQLSIKPHVDTPRPPINRFLNKDKLTSTDFIEVSDESNN